MPTADLDLLIKTVFRDGRTQVSYTLQSPSGRAGFSYREIAGPELSGRPQDYQAYLITKIEKLGEGRDVDGSPLLNEEIERKLTKIGRELYLELFPPEMRQAYREIRRQEVQSIRIISNEPWIPWELIKPFDASLPGDVLDDEFLCLQFELTRWLAGDPAPAPRSEVRVRRLACILTTTSLSKIGEEKTFLAELAQRRPGVQDASPVLSSSSAAEAFLEAGGVDLLHFAGHGIFDAGQPNESALPFPDGSVLRPTDLAGPLAARIAQDRPLVFLNACSVGQQSWSLTRLGGWADRWVRICGCGAFVAPLWPVRDSLALEFAKAFYNALASGETFGQAGRSARQHVRKLAPASTSWLAYSIYADVHGRLALGDSEPPEPPMMRDAAPEIRRHIRDFTLLIKRKTEGFVQNPKVPSGYVLILGEPGIGKTSVMAELVRLKGYPHHFNMRSEGIQKPDQFFSNLCAQLIRDYELGYSSLPPEAARDAQFFKILLEQAAAKLRAGGKKLLILVDALDEADPRAVARGSNTLYLPSDLPPNIFMVVTSRRGSYQLQFACEGSTIDLEREGPNQFEDVRLFAQNHLSHEGIRAYIAAQRLDEVTFVDEIVKRSEGNFMYLRYVLPEIENGTYKTRDFDTIPVGLQRYYDDQWLRMKELDTQGWFEYKLPVLVALTVAKEPISTNLIADFSGVKERARVQKALEEWSQFLESREAEDDDGKPQKRYRLYHDSFHDFMANKDQVKEKGVDLKAANRQAADVLWRELYPEG